MTDGEVDGEENLIAHIGSGLLKPQDSGMQTEVHIKFKHWQTFNGTIYVETIDVTEEAASIFPEYFQTYRFSLTGELENGDTIEIPNLYMIHQQISSELKKNNLVFISGKSIIRHKQLELEKPIWYKFCLWNVDFTRMLAPQKIEKDWGEIFFTAMENHKELVKKMDDSGQSLASGFLNIKIDNPTLFCDNNERFEEEVLDFSQKILTGLSIAKSASISYGIIEIRQPNKEEWELKKLYLISPKYQPPSFSQPLIHNQDLMEFIKIFSDNYDEILDEKFGLAISIEWCVESFSRGQNLESKFIKACTSLEVLKDRFAKSEDIEYILEEELFNKLYDYMKMTTKKYLKEEGIGKSTRSEIYANLMGIKRRSIRNTLLKLLEGCGFNPRNYEKTLNDIIRIRNKITHTGISDKDFKFLSEIYDRMISLIQKIVLSIINYEGHYLDRTKEYKRTIFSNG